MSHEVTEIACSCCLRRRQFLKGCVGCSLASPVLFAGNSLLGESSSPSQPASPQGRVRVRLVFACWALVQDRPTWPHIGHDMRPEIERVTNALRQGCPDIEFLPVAAHSVEDAEKILKQHESDQISGYLVYNMNNWVPVFQPIAASGHPMILSDFLYAGSGGFLTNGSRFRSKHKNMCLIASSNTEDLVTAAKCFATLKTGDVQAFVEAVDRTRRERTPAPRLTQAAEDRLEIKSIGQCLEELKKCRIVSVGGGSKEIAKGAQERLGITVDFVDFDELAAAAEAVEADKVTQLAERWKTEAQKIAIDNPDETLQLSARNYLGQKALLEKHQAEAITINCLGGFYSGKLRAYPCLGFVELLNTGLVGACEADLNSTVTMVAMNHLVGRPGYISDPVIDTANRYIVYAHCVATTKAFGPQGPANPYEILTHSEDRRGASVRSYLPVGYLTSTMEILPNENEIIFHQGMAAENVVIDRACRTKLACEVKGDIEKLLHGWNHGWHRVTFYGDLREPVKELTAALGFKFSDEA